MLSAAVPSSEVLMVRRVWGIVAAVWAMMAASRLSVLALPGRARQVAHCDAHVPGAATVTARAGVSIVAGWSTTTSRCLLQLRRS